MVIKLYKNGKELCEVDNVEINPGGQQSGADGAGQESKGKVPVAKSPDTISFTVPTHFGSTEGEFYLKDNRGNVFNIAIDSITGSSVKALIQKYFLQIVLSSNAEKKGSANPDSSAHQIMGKYPLTEHMIARRIKEAMEISGLSCTDLARAMNVSKNTVLEWHKKGQVRAIDLYRIANRTNTPISFFFWAGPEK